MTTKYKIIFGFLLMVLLLGGVAVLGYGGLQRSSDGFGEYRRLAGFNTAMSDLLTAMYSSAYNGSEFSDSRKPANAQAVLKGLDTAQQKAKDAETFVLKPERRTALQGIRKDLDSFRNSFTASQKHIVAAYEQYNNVVQPNMRAMQGSLLDISAQAKSAGNLDAMMAIAETWPQLANARSAMSRFAESRSSDDTARTRQFLTEVGNRLKVVSGILRTAEGRKVFGELEGAFAALQASFAKMGDASALAEQEDGKMANVLISLEKTTIALNSEVDADMRAQEAAALASNTAAQRTMLLVGGVGLLLGVGFAALTIFGIVRVLTQLSGFAGAVAQGDFSYSLSIREKGEIGRMVEAMRQIPSVLERVTQEANSLADGILSGRYRDRMDAASFSGSFSNLAGAVNTVSEAYTGVMDSLPAPIMTCDKQNKVLFLNKIAQGAVGGNLTNTKCADSLKAAECNSDKCFGVCAMSRNAAHTGETSIFPQGKRMDILVTALPLRNLNQEVVGYTEIITDLTEIKAKQATMLQVARDASEISDRVAAASEELAAQVEQISRGAEVQRSRVESTASAMTEMNSTVLEVARNAGQASEQSDGTRQKAEEGADLVNKVVSSINAVNTVAVTLQDNMQELGKQAESIGGVMNVISDIADQTNLLALNAAIEAARAGEAGRGFAVVADEVRKLAEKTMTATQEVGSSISAIQHSARVNIDEVGAAVKSITDATGLANSSGEALKEIVDLAGANSSVVTSIATAAEEQSATSEEINRALEEINKVVAETTDGMVQSSAAVQDLSRMAQELRRVMEGLK